jgi:predicted DsbA family dithiol-disulfide isomerase
MDLVSFFPPERIKAMRDRLNEVADQLGVAIGTQDHAPSTKPALVLSAFARDRGLLDAFRTVTMDAYWRDGRNIEDRAVLAELAEAAGLSADDALAALDDDSARGILHDQRKEAMRWGVTGIPTWFMLPTGWTPDGSPPPEDGPQAVKVVGCQPLAVVVEAAQLAGAVALDDV